MKFWQAYASKLHKVKYETVCSWYWNYKKGKLNKNQGPDGPRNLEYYKKRYELLKKLRDFYNYQKKNKLIFIKENISFYSLKLLLEITELKHSYWDKYKNCNFKEKDQEALINIVKVFNEKRKQYGYRQIIKELKYIHNIIYNSKKVLRIMQENNIQAEFIRKWGKNIN